MLRHGEASRWFQGGPAPKLIAGKEIVMDRVRRPADRARKSAARLADRRRGIADAYRRETFVLEREAARVKAREILTRFPKAAYMTEVESWRELADGRIEFTMRRLPSAD
jgi:hypothetical protein